jgi:hypothetical protein
LTSAKIKNCFIHPEFCSTPTAETSGEKEMEPATGEMFSSV